MKRNNREQKFFALLFSFYLFSLFFYGSNLSTHSSETKPPKLTPLTATPFKAPVTKKKKKAHSHPLHWIECGGKKWLNYNHRRKKLASSHLDWPIGIIIYGHASIKRVKKIFGGQRIASKKYQVYDLGHGPRWDSDAGTKLPAMFDGPDGFDMDSLHIRVYAPPPGYFDGNGGWGHYVIVSAHLDFNLPWDTQNGYSEDAEQKALHVFKRSGFEVYPNYAFIHNPEKLRKRKGRYWQSNGFVSLVYLPPESKEISD